MRIRSIIQNSQSHYFTPTHAHAFSPRSISRHYLHLISNPLLFLENTKARPALQLLNLNYLGVRGRALLAGRLVFHYTWKGLFVSSASERRLWADDQAGRQSEEAWPMGILSTGGWSMGLVAQPNASPWVHCVVEDFSVFLTSHECMQPP